MILFHKHARKIFIFIIAIIIFCPVRASHSAAKKSPSNIDSQIAAEEKKREELSRQVQAYKKQIRDMGAQVEGLLTKVNTLQQDENMALQELTVLELQGKKIEENIVPNVNVISEINNESFDSLNKSKNVFDIDFPQEENKSENNEFSQDLLNNSCTTFNYMYNKINETYFLYC
mgnify:CR=1 FL=1